MKNLLALIAMMATSASLFAEDRFANVKVETYAVQGNVYALFGAGGNIGVSKGDDGLLMIDDQFAPLANKIKAALGELGDETPAWLLNTHYHGDHTGGNAIFGTDSMIMAHDNVRVRLLGGETPAVADALPVVTYNDEASIFFNGEEVRLIHMAAGHTDGDTVVYFKGSDVVHMGDHFFRDRFPYVDLGAGGTVQGLTANIERTLAMISDSTRVIPGHGALAEKADLARYLEMLKDTTATVTAAIKAGKTTEEAIADGLGAKWSTWGAGFINEERWIQTLYGSLSK